MTYWLGILVIFANCFFSSVYAKTCLFVNFSSKGIIYSDLIQQGASQVLIGKCSFEVFYLEERKYPEEKDLKKRALSAKNWILSKTPDLVIVSGDSSVENVMVPYFKNSKIPFVFTAVVGNLTHYGLPYPNSTGVSVRVVDERTILALKKAIPNLKHVALIGEKNKTNEKLLLRAYKNMLSPHSIEIKPFLATSFEEFKILFQQAQQESQAVLWGSIVNMSGWEEKSATDYISENTRLLTVASINLAMPYSVLGIVKDPMEYGILAAQMATQILEGKDPATIPITTNRIFTHYINESLLSKTEFKLEQSFLKKAKKFISASLP